MYFHVLSNEDILDASNEDILGALLYRLPNKQVLRVDWCNLVIFHSLVYREVQVYRQENMVLRS